MASSLYLCLLFFFVQYPNIKGAPEYAGTRLPAVTARPDAASTPAATSGWKG